MPEINYFGIEWARWFWRYASDRLRRHDCINARGSARRGALFLAEFVPDDSAVASCTSISPIPGRRRGITSGG